MRATMAGVIMGTAGYMAPEQARGHDVDKRADIWAFGVVVYEVLTGRQLFTGPTISDTLAAVLKEEPAWDLVPAPLRRLVRLCLVKDPRRRLQAIGDARILLDEPQVPAAPMPARRRNMLSWAVAAVLGLTSIGLGVLYWRATRLADRPLVRLRVDLGPEAVVGPRITAVISPDGTRLAFVARDANKKELLATRRLDQPKAVLLDGTEGAGDPFFSPEGDWIGFFAGGKMKKISVQGGAVVTLCDAPTARGASWGEDGSIIVTLATGVGLSRVPAAGGTPRTLTKPADSGEASHRWPQILPGAQVVLFTGNTASGAYDSASIEALSLRTGQIKVVQRGGYFGRYLPSGHLMYMHERTLFAVPFDVDRLEARGTPAPVLEDMAGNANFGGGGQFDFARNGTFVYLSGKPSQAWPIVWLESAGKTATLLDAPVAYACPRFSPNGQRLAFMTVGGGGFNIQVYDWARATMAPLAFAGQGSHYSPVWTPDGKHIAFISDSAGNSRIQWIRSDGAGEAQTLLENKAQARPFSFSPDGKRLAFYQFDPDTNYDLWTLPLDISDPDHPKPAKPEPLLRTPAIELEPAFSHDGRWMAYTSNESGKFEVYVRPFPPGAGGKWPISAGGGQHPIWSRHARELFYEIPDNRIMVATYAIRGDTFVPDKPRLWSNTQILDTTGLSITWNLDLAPDGKRFAVFPRSEGAGEQKGSVHVTFLGNFFDYLRRQVPAGGK